MQRHHDMGGMPAGPVERAEHDHAPWEKRVDAILRLLTDRKRRIMTVDELGRRMAEVEARWKEAAEQKLEGAQ